jgi:hypothetical protein
MTALSITADLANLANQLIDINDTYKTYNDPNATRLDKANAALNAAGLVTETIESLHLIFGPAAILGGLGTAQSILISELKGSASQLISNQAALPRL